ncbi:MAG TPA: asparagine synthase (glutamine-hydrolyzing) [Mucilaginibacter sp.]|nr:asparagine synthase (glutamine-hydrolyzing) [Mucilaginibacter sp.]
MCRIAGIISDKLPLGEIKAKLKAMCDTLKHGGPDDEGMYADERANLVFGHRRLSIIDLSQNGHQPMLDAGAQTCITFNGEIYNYRELKQQLRKAGVKFQSETDTEVILAAYLHWGVGSFDMLRGMFAFALYDAVKSVTYLVRGSTGIKPLYYSTNDGQLIFASEVRAFKASGMANTTDPTWRVRFLSMGHIPEPYTTLKNVFSLQKGHYLTWDHTDNSFSIRSYLGNSGITSYIDNAEAAKAEIHDCLRMAVKRQLIADAPIGVFLSGGVDSSLLTLLANQEDQKLKTVSIYFNEQSYNERSFQNIVLDRLTAEKFSHLVQQRDFDMFFPHIINNMDMPTTDGINTWFISKYARMDGLKAVLSGVGADEVFGGYPSFNRIKYLKYLRMLPAALLKISSHFSADRYRKISFLAHPQPLADYLLLRGLYATKDIAQILDTDVAEVEEILFGENMIPDLGDYDKNRAAWLETNIYMQNQLLRDTDVMSMTHGLEVRVPYLDEDFQRLVNRISPEIKFGTNPPKKILIESFGDLLPEAVWKRPKMGFTFPLQEWMGKHCEISNADLYRGKLAKELVNKFKNNQLHWSKIFALYQIQLHD